MHKFPWGKFYWDKWLNDPALQSCDLNAQGLWINMLCLMHRSEKIGFLIVNGKAMSVGEVARRVGIRKDRAERLIKALKENNVCSVDENGVIYCRYIAREQLVTPAQNSAIPVDNIHQPDDNRTKTERKSYDNRRKNTGKSTVAAIPSIKSKEIEFKKEKRKKEQLTGEVNQTFSTFMKTACKRLQEVAKIDATKALAQIEVWFEEAALDGEVVLKAIEAGWGKEYPIGYISKVVATLSHKSLTSERWVIDGGKHDDDPAFRMLSRDEQLALLILEKQQNIP
ncbi:unnamed protein product, partial [Commensalibacter papalotli (ex Botero et al. 2024)]